jgi:hypothetical protein
MPRHGGLSPGVAASKQPHRCASPRNVGPGETRLVVVIVVYVVSYITFCYRSILSATFWYVSTFVIGDLGGSPKFQALKSSYGGAAKELSSVAGGINSVSFSQKAIERGRQGCILAGLTLVTSQTRHGRR